MLTQRNLPSYLYYAEKNENAVYGINPPGALNVERLLAGKPCWRQPVSDIQIQSKTIILADWTQHYKTTEIQRGYAMNGNYSSFDIPVIRLITDLLDNGFEMLYFDDKQNLQQLTAANFDSSDIKQYFPTDIQPKESIERRVIEEKKLTKDKLFILDDIWMSVLCSHMPNKIDQPKKLYISCLQVLLKLHQKEEVADLVKERYDTIVWNPGLEIKRYIDIDSDSYIENDELVALKGL